MPKFLAFTLFSVAAAMSPKALAARRCVLSLGQAPFHSVPTTSIGSGWARSRSQRGARARGGCRGRREGGSRLTGHARAPSQVRGGGAVGPITEDFGMGLSRTLAGVSIGSAVLEKYAGAASTTLSSAVSGDVFTTNAAIVFASYVTGIIAGDHFKAVDVAASLWIASVVLKLKDAGVDADSIQSNIVNIAVAAVMGVVAFTD